MNSFSRYKQGSTALEIAATGRRREVGIAKLDGTTAKMLNIPKDKDRIKSEADKQLLQHVKATHDLSDFSPMNACYGPHSGISEGERLIRAYKLGLLRPKDKK